MWVWGQVQHGESACQDSLAETLYRRKERILVQESERPGLYPDSPVSCCVTLDKSLNFSALSLLTFTKQEGCPGSEVFIAIVGAMEPSLHLGSRVGASGDPSSLGGVGELKLPQLSPSQWSFKRAGSGICDALHESSIPRGDPSGRVPVLCLSSQAVSGLLTGGQHPGPRDSVPLFLSPHAQHWEATQKVLTGAVNKQASGTPVSVSLLHGDFIAGFFNPEDTSQT